MTRPRRFDPQDMARALAACHGKAYRAARLLKCSPQTVYAYIERFREVRRASELGWSAAPSRVTETRPPRLRSTIERLPPPLKERLDKMLEQGFTYDAITHFLQTRGHQISRSVISRYAQQLRLTRKRSAEVGELAKDRLREALLDRLAAELVPRLEAKRAALAQANDDTVAGYARSLGLGEVEWHEADGEHEAGHWLVSQNELQYLGAEDGAARAVLDSMAALAELGLL